jgi:hypothetical protein
MDKRLLAGRKQFARRVGSLFRFKHQAEQRGMLERTADVGAGDLDQARLKILPAPGCGATESDAKTLEATQRLTHETLSTNYPDHWRHERHRPRTGQTAPGP